MAELTSIDRDELKRLQEDAARYHFVRDVTDFNTWETLASMLPDEWDDYVDAAMLSAQGDSHE